MVDAPLWAVSEGNPDIFWKWPRGLKAKLIRRAGTKYAECTLCASQQRVAIHHYWESPVPGQVRDSPYVDENGKPRFDLKYLILLCQSCHGKVHTALENTPFMRMFRQTMEEIRIK